MVEYEQFIVYRYNDTDDTFTEFYRGEYVYAVAKAVLHSHGTPTMVSNASNMYNGAVYYLGLKVS